VQAVRLAVAVTVARADWNLPLLRRDFVTLRGMPSLRQRKTGTTPRTFERDADFGHAVLVEKRGERRAHGPPGCRVERAEEVVDGRIAVTMMLQILANAAAERLFADPGLEHADDRRALLVGDRIECVENVAALSNRLANAAGRSEPVLLDRVGARVDALGAAFIAGLPGIDGFFCEPRGECLVQPDVVPPRRRHQVAEPLMRDLVRGDAHERMAERRRRRPGLQQNGPAVRDHARVLHCEPYAERDRDMVEFRKRVRDAEPAFLELEECGQRPDAVCERGPLPPWREKTHRRWPAPERPGALRVPMADGERNEIRRQRIGGREADELSTVRDILLRHDGRVRDGRHVARDAERDPPRRLEVRLVEAGKRFPRRYRLELRHRIPRAAVLEREDPSARLAVLRGAVGEPQPMPAGRQRGLERETQKLLTVRRDANLRSGIACGSDRRRCIDARFRHVDAVGIQPDERMRSIELDVDRDLARGPRLAGDDCQRDVVPDRTCALRQPQLGHGGFGRRGNVSRGCERAVHRHGGSDEHRGGEPQPCARTHDFLNRPRGLSPRASPTAPSVSPARRFA
jgi:hypothetical protein